MKLRKVISGGQTGADRTGLECAKEMGLETGGTAPNDWRIDGGKDPSLKDFGLVESKFSDYPPRTRQNVSDADVTVWFGKTTSPGYFCTRNAAKLLNKPFYTNPAPLVVRYLANEYEIWNVAGNRERMNPGVCELVRDAFKLLLPVSGPTVAEKTDSPVVRTNG